jgi:hypothetical protein
MKLSNRNGFALPATLLMILLLVTLGAAAPLYTTSEHKSTNHYNTGNQAMFAAEAGMMRAISLINQAGGVTHFKTDVVDKWGQIFSPSTQTLPGYPAFSYTVTASANATNPGNRGTLTVTGYAPYRAKRVLRAGVMRRSTGSGIGALYLAADSVDIKFSGNAFDIDGNDHGVTGLLTPGGTVAPGIATRNENVTNTVKGELNSQQKDNVRGAEFSLSPLNPSVVTTGGPSIFDLETIISKVLSDPRVEVDSRSSINGNVTFGTLANPKVTRLTAAETKIHANGNATGAGILIVDGSITINGNLNFIGWIIVRGDTIINDGYNGDETTVLGNAAILGSLWTGDMVVKVGGSAIIDYCEVCLNLLLPASGGGYLPQTVALTSWEEVL